MVTTPNDRVIVAWILAGASALWIAILLFAPADVAFGLLVTCVYILLVIVGGMTNRGANP